jgi:phosphocarrier protein HPr
VGDLKPDGASVRRETTVVNRQGWHARPSAMVVRCANAFKADVEIEINGLLANGKSMMDVIMLASPVGSIVRIETTGPDAEACADALVKLISDGFGEDLA